MASTSQRNSLQAEIQRLGQETDWNSMPIPLVPKLANDAPVWQQMEWTASNNSRQRRRN